MDTVFQTLSGTTYRIYADTNTLVREPHTASHTLRRDLEHVKILEIHQFEIGKRAEFSLDLRQDGTASLRSTNIVVGIVHLEKEDE